MSNRDIKDLSFAVEALSRLPHMKEELARVEDLLRDAIRKEEVRIPRGSTTATDDEEIPF